MNCLRTGTLKHGWIFLVNFKKPSPGLLNNFFLKKRELGQVWEKGPETRTRWVLKSETRPTLVQTPTGNKCDNVKTGTRRFSSKRGPGQNWWVPRLPSDRPSVPLVVSVRRVPRPNRTLGTCALRALRCVASSPPARPRCVWLSRARIVCSAVVSVFPPTLPLARETEAGISVWCCCKRLWWLFVAWFFVFFFPDFTTGLYCLRKEGRKEGKKYALSLLSLWGCGVCSQELSEVVRCVLWGESRGFCVLLFEHVLRLRCEVVEFFGVKDWERVLFRGRGRAP